MQSKKRSQTSKQRGLNKQTRYFYILIFLCYIIIFYRNGPNFNESSYWSKSAMSGPKYPAVKQTICNRQVPGSKPGRSTGHPDDWRLSTLCPPFDSNSAITSRNTVPLEKLSVVHLVKTLPASHENHKGSHNHTTWASWIQLTFSHLILSCQF